MDERHLWQQIPGPSKNVVNPPRFRSVPRLDARIERDRTGTSTRWSLNLRLRSNAGPTHAGYGIFLYEEGHFKLRNRGIVYAEDGGRAERYVWRTESSGDVESRDAAPREWHCVLPLSDAFQGSTVAVRVSLMKLPLLKRDLDTPDLVAGERVRAALGVFQDPITDDKLALAFPLLVDVQGGVEAVLKAESLRASLSGDMGDITRTWAVSLPRRE